MIKAVCDKCGKEKSFESKDYIHNTSDPALNQWCQITPFVAIKGKVFTLCYECATKLKVEREMVLKNVLNKFFKGIKQ